MRRILLITGTLGYWALVLALSATPALAQSITLDGLLRQTTETVNADYQTAQDTVNNAVVWGQADAARKAAEAEAARLAAEQAAAAAAAQQAAAQQATVQQAAQVAANEEGDAWSILNGLIAQYPILSGASIGYGDAGGYQACAYYKSGYIEINPTHTASLSTLIYHEAMHIINYRQSGQTSE